MFVLIYFDYEKYDSVEVRFFNSLKSLGLYAFKHCALPSKYYVFNLDQIFYNDEIESYEYSIEIR